MGAFPCGLGCTARPQNTCNRHRPCKRAVAWGQSGACVDAYGRFWARRVPQLSSRQNVQRGQAYNDANANPSKEIPANAIIIVEQAEGTLSIGGKHERGGAGALLHAAGSGEQRLVLIT